MRLLCKGLLILLMGFMSACSAAQEKKEKLMSDDSNLEVITLGAGCFWCVEAVFQRIDGVVDVESGYMGGHVDNPTYEIICTGKSGHAEVLRVQFDTRQTSLEEILTVFWHSHDPTTLNRQGADAGTQYRSAVFYNDDEQRTIAEAVMLKAQADWDDPIVTEITEVSKFYPAEGYHQDYYNNNKGAGYCRMVIAPKLRKLGLDE